MRSGELVKLKSAETDRYKPYADLYNKALDELATVSDLPLRPEPVHRLRLCRADPRAIKSNFPGTGENLERKPDLVRTSRHAAEKTHKPGDQYFGDKPSRAFEWSQVLSCEEMKAWKGGVTPGSEEVLKGKVFDSTAERQKTECCERSLGTRTTSSVRRRRLKVSAQQSLPPSRALNAAVQNLLTMPRVLTRRLASKPLLGPLHALTKRLRPKTGIRTRY